MGRTLLMTAASAPGRPLEILNLQTDANAQTVTDQDTPPKPTIAQLLARYRRPQVSKSLFQLLITLGLWAGMWPIM